MSKPTITEADFTAAIEKAVADKGADYVYDGACVYSRDGEPACIVGTALANLGFEMNPEWDLDVDGQDSLAIRVLPSFFDVPDRVVGAAQDAQHIQDARHSWGDALNAYKTAVSA